MKLCLRIMVLLLVLMIIMPASACQRAENLLTVASADGQQLLDDSSGQFMNMWVGSDEATVSGGDSRALAAATFEESGTIYVPLTDVAVFLGGTVTPETDGKFTIAYDETIRGVQYEKNITIRLGDCNATDNTNADQYNLYGELVATCFSG